MKVSAEGIYTDVIRLRCCHDEGCNEKKTQAAEADN